MQTPAFILLASLASAADFDDSRLVGAFPDAEVQSVQEAAVAPWLEVVLADGQVVYATPDGRHLMVGSLIDLDGPVNLTDHRRNSLRRDLLADGLPDDLFEYPAPEGDRWVTVVTDIDCPYCRRLHQQMDEYHAQGISVRYLMLPRAGLGSASHRKAENAACAADPEQALTDAMNGTELEALECDNSIKDQFSLVRTLRVTGTPAIIDETGRMISGYVPAQRLAAELARP